MEENLILYGCKLAKEIEKNLPMLGNQPETLLASCDEIINVFSSVRDRLIVSQGQPADHHDHGGGGAEWLRTGGTSSVTTSTQREPMKGMLLEQQPTSSSGLDFMFGGRVGAVGQIQTPPDFITTSSSSKHPKQRKNEGEKVVTRVPAPQMGNLDVPPEDGYTWRKYGQKDILGSKYPRSYYRCTHQKFCQCPAKKQVQRLDDDPSTFEITYRGTHTCHMSSTAPVPPPPPALSAFSSSLADTTHWLSMHIFQGVSSGGAGPSADSHLPVADMADAMFNSGSSTSSMDLIFSSMDDKWDSEVKKSQLDK